MLYAKADKQHALPERIVRTAMRTIDNRLRAARFWRERGERLFNITWLKDKLPEDLGKLLMKTQNASDVETLKAIMEIVETIDWTSQAGISDAYRRLNIREPKNVGGPVTLR